ncbi:MAG: IS66 family transposase, partial [Kurthia sp.]
MSYTVVRKIQKKKRNDSFHEDVETEEIHHHPSNTQCDCCQGQMTEVGTVLAREEAKIIPAKIVRIRHIEYTYECKKDVLKKAQMKRGKAPQAVIQRSIAGPTVQAKLIYDKFVQYLPLYRQVNEWQRHGLITNDKNLSNWVIRVTEEWLLPLFELMKQLLTAKSILHVDETYGKIINRSDGKSGQSNAYNWVFRSISSQGPIIILFQSALTRSRSVLENFLTDFKGTVICDGYSVYGKLPGVTFANCLAHVRRYWLKANCKNGKIGVDYCDQLYQLERQIKHLSPSKRRKARNKHSKSIVETFLKWINEAHHQIPGMTNSTTSFQA